MSSHLLLSLQEMRKKPNELKKRIGSKVKVLSGDEGLLEAASDCDYDILVSSLVGFAGLTSDHRSNQKR
jgi:1-deoxy-D-xylulose 5-phosphate reductoisomerase